MFIPMELNAPLLVGGALSWYVSTRTKNKDENNARAEKGTLIASGFIAGGALMGVVSAIIKFGGIDVFAQNWINNEWSQIVSLIAYIILITYFVKATKK
jgi:uncharacterized oligopeptide transporter (OPT) family protein